MALALYIHSKLVNQSSQHQSPPAAGRNTQFDCKCNHVRTAYTRCRRGVMCRMSLAWRFFLRWIDL